ncbi:MAG: sigma-70 family RNA polymerase sigma factor [Kofleriaceae bacterium]|nr:sigma-70 family RNA polymerase sigma factor [Kofleriaceae bacterium]MCL4225129.1 sigma-70 family RNA polymerase sigma factor [Myxococcales bacterium]
MNADRSELAERHLDLARRAAALFHARVRAHISLEELVAMANLGLAEAASRYDPTAGASFRTFAWYRVQGAILDGLRRHTALPRGVWIRITTLRAAASYLEAQADRAAAARDATLAATTADRLHEVKAALGAIRTMYAVSLDQIAPERMPTAEAADEPLIHERRRTEVAEALAALPERERALLEKHYVEGKTLVEAGAELGLSRSWASRLHARAVDRLRARLLGSG